MSASSSPVAKRAVLAALAIAAVAVVVWSQAPGEADAYTGTWTTPTGEPAERGAGRDRSYEVHAFRLPDHCDWQSAVALNVAWPLGTTQHVGEPGEVRQYVRDPEDVVRKRAGLDLDAELPAGSRATGYRTGDVELWFGPDGGDRFAYLVDGDDVERWPLPAEPPACA